MRFILLFVVIAAAVLVGGALIDNDVAAGDGDTKPQRAGISHKGHLSDSHQEKTERTHPSVDMRKKPTPAGAAASQEEGTAEMPDRDTSGLSDAPSRYSAADSAADKAITDGVSGGITVEERAFNVMRVREAREMESLHRKQLRSARLQWYDTLRAARQAAEISGDYTEVYELETRRPTKEHPFF